MRDDKTRVRVLTAFERDLAAIGKRRDAADRIEKTEMRAAVPPQTATRIPRHNRRFHFIYGSGAAMNLHTWWLFVATVFVVSAIPGPNMLLVMTHGARHGLRRSTATMAGCMTALVAMLSVSAAGLGVFLEAWPAMFDALRFAGGA